MKLKLAKCTYEDKNENLLSTEKIMPCLVAVKNMMGMQSKKIAISLNGTIDLDLSKKCLERLVLKNIKAALPTTLDTHQYAYIINRSTDDATSTVL